MKKYVLSYPEELIHDIIEIAKLQSDDRILEIGAGTGKATIQFANMGYQIRAIEIGEDMAEILRDKCADYSNITIDVHHLKIGLILKTKNMT